MAGEWKTLRIGDLGRIVTGKTPSTKVKENFGEDLPFVTPSDMDSRKTINETERYLSNSGAGTVKNAVLPAGAVIVSCIGSDMGKAAIAGSECVTNQQINSIIVGDEWCAEYVYYDLSTRKAELQNLASSGSAQPILNKGHFSQIPIVMPPLPEQRSIASILGSLDDKIELNRRMNETLESLARALFKSWFVDFDPVRAKMEGRQPAGMDDETDALFPDSFEDSGLGEIPKRWRADSFSEMIELTGGGTPKTSIAEYWNGEIPWFSVVDAPKDSDVFVVDTDKHVTEAGIANSSTKLLSAGTTIISARGTVGRCALVSQPMAMNQSCYGLNGYDGRGDYFTYFATRRMVAELQQHAHGSVFSTITRNTFRGVRVAIPPPDLTKKYDQTVSSYMQLILTNLRQSRTLAEIRDALLLKLLSGEVRVGEAEEIVEEAL